MGSELLKNQDSTDQCNDFIVVASLIEKVPNMGGLTWTCLNLGMKALVIPHLSHISNEEFK